MISSNYKPTERAREMFPLVEKFLNITGLTQKEFCQQQEIRLSTFKWWLKIYRIVNSRAAQKAKPSTQQFVPIELKTSITDNNPTHCKIEYPNGVIIHLCGQLDSTFIVQLVQTTGV